MIYHATLTQRVLAVHLSSGGPACYALRKGRNPSLASIYRAFAEHHKAQSNPQAIELAHAEFAALHTGS
jgi:hypothetical protein